MADNMNKENDVYYTIEENDRIIPPLKPKDADKDKGKKKDD